MLNKEKRGILLGIGVGYVHLLVGFLSIFFLTPIIIKYVGQSVYGLWAVLNSIVGYFLLFDFGTNTSVAKYTAEYGALDKKETLSDMASAIFFFILLVGALIVVLAAVFSFFIPRIFKIPAELISSGKIAFVIMSLNIALLLTAGVFGNIIYGYQRVDVWKSFAILQLTAYMLLTILALRLGFGLIGMAVAITISNFLLLFLNMTFLKRSGYDISVKPRWSRLKKMKEIVPYSLRTFALVLTSRVLYYTSSIIIGIFLGTSMVTSYDIAYKLCFYITALFGIISTTIFPQFSKLYTLGDIDSVRNLYVKATKASLAIMMPIAIFLIFLGEPFINLWVGKENFVGMQVLAFFIAMNFIHAVGTPAGLLLQGIGKNKALLCSEIINAGLNLLFSIILVRKLGLMGVALGGVGACVCTSAWVVPFLACKYTKLSIGKLVTSAVLPPIFAGLVAGLPAWWLVHNLPSPENYLYVIIDGTVVLAVYAAVYIVFALTSEEREMYLSLVPYFKRFSKKIASSNGQLAIENEKILR